MDLIFETFEPEFMQRALIGGLIAVVATSLVGTWVVLRGLSFLGDALAHGVVPGVALAVMAGVNPILGAFVAALVMSGLVTIVSSRTIVRDDTAIGLLFVGMLSLGVVLVSRSQSFTTDLTALLFGDVLGVTRSDIMSQLIITAVVVVGTTLLYRPLLALTFNATKAHTLGMYPKIAQAGLLVLVSLSIVASFQAIGTLLVFALLVGPPATASLMVRRVRMIMVTSMALGAVSVFAGLVISFHYATAGGATVAGVSIAQFFVVLVFREIAAAVSARTPSMNTGTHTDR